LLAAQLQSWFHQCCVLLLLFALQLLAQASLEGLVFSTGGNLLHEVLLHNAKVSSFEFL
jgi:hypothetical protein